MRTTQEMEDIKFRDTIGDADIDSTIVTITEKQQAEELKERKEKVKEKINKEAERGQQDIEMFLQHEK